jgi:ribosomal protein S18 acetylase RimI-like enzyme
MTGIEVVKIDEKNNYLINDFLSNAGSSLDSFRYFAKRPLSIISNHICTFLFIKNNIPICYGHLDKDEDIIWLGIAVIEKEKGNGLGKKMMAQLIQTAKEQNIPSIHLTVDTTNENAIKLYEKFGFKIEKKMDTYNRYSLKTD